MDEKTFYSQFRKKSQEMKISPSPSAWSRLDSKLNRYRRQRRTRRISMWSSAAMLLLFCGIYWLVYQAETRLIVEGPLPTSSEQLPSVYINQKPNLASDRTQDFDHRMGSNLKVIDNPQLHARFVELVSEETRRDPAISDPSHRQLESLFSSLNNEWIDRKWTQISPPVAYDFPETIRITSIDQIQIGMGWNDSSSTFVRIPGQTRHFVKQSDDGMIQLLEFVPGDELIFKHFDQKEERFIEAHYRLN